MTQLPDVSSSYRLASERIDSFHRNGHVRLEELADRDEIAVLRPGLVAAGEKCRIDNRPLEERDTYGQAFIQMFNLWRQSEAARAFVFSRRFARVAAELMGVDGVRIYHDQALFKEAGGGYTPWHQDQFYWPLDTPHTITLWMPLVDVSEDMGPMTFASGSHRLGNLGEFPIGDRSQQEFGRIIAERGLTTSAGTAFAAGDASFHSGWTLHSATPNRSPHLREVMTIIYFAADTRVGPLDHPTRRFDRDVWLPGCEPGEPAASPLNPILYSASA